MIKIWHISDTHDHHWLLEVPSNIDVVIHSGDESNWLDPYKNEKECRDFLYWFSNLPIKHKVFIPGNHSSAIAKGLVTRAEIETMGIVYLENEHIIIEGFKIFGCPWTKTFGPWPFMTNDVKLKMMWELVEEDTDIIISHGPPYGILDIAMEPGGIKLCGDRALLVCAVDVVKPQLVLFGHLHNNGGVINAGVRTIPESDVIFSNGSVCTDDMFGIVTSNGNIFTLKEPKSKKAETKIITTKEEES